MIWEGWTGAARADHDDREHTQAITERGQHGPYSQAVASPSPGTRSRVVPTSVLVDPGAEEHPVRVERGRGEVNVHHTAPMHT